MKPAAQIRTISQLKTLLREREISPEKLAKELKISNMTIRRLLMKDDDAILPEKYHAQFDRMLPADRTGGSAPQALPEVEIDENAMGLDMRPFLLQIEKEGAAYSDWTHLRSELKKKWEDQNLGGSLRAAAKKLHTLITSNEIPARYRSLSVGALLYLINPVDLIPDVMPAVGYLDDFAVLSLVFGMIRNRSSLS